MGEKNKSAAQVHRPERWHMGGDSVDQVKDLRFSSESSGDPLDAFPQRAT